MNGVRVTGITLTVLIWSVLGLESVWAVSNPRGMLFRAVGIYQGEVEEGKCKVPNATGGFADYSRAVCRDSTEVVTDDGTIVYPTRMFPDLTTNGNFCGGFLVLQNSMFYQAVNVYKVKVRYKMPGRGFPILCRAYRKFTLGVGSTVPPVNSTFVNPFGATNVSVMQLLPIYSPDLLNCLRDPLRGNVAAPVTVRAKIRAFAYLDDGRKIKSNKVSYSLTLLPAGWEVGASGGLYPRGDPLRCGSAVP
jgi:hypothetical protein